MRLPWDITDHSHDPADIVARIRTPKPQGGLSDIVYGGIDGSVASFAIVFGMAGAGLSPFVIIALKTANVLANGFSMAAGNYSSTKSEADNTARVRAI